VTTALSRRYGVAWAALAVLVIALAGGAWWALTPASPPAPVPVAQGLLPDGFKALDPPLDMSGFAFQDGDGKTVRISDFRGRPVLLNIWAKWCAPCIKELPLLNNLQKNGGTLKVLAIAVDEPDPAKVRGFLINRGITALDPYLDPKNVFQKALAIHEIPMSLLIDKNGYAMVRVDAPVNWDSGGAVALMQRTIL
jgi:thiol-disulfide isomerase/thioredoxin